MKEEFALPDYIKADEIKRIRKQLALTQKEFAKFVGVSKPTIERWESSDEPIRGPIILLLRMLEREPEMVDYYRIPEKKYPLRMWYMHEQEKCTLIDVDEIRRIVKIRNYTDHVFFRAFGNNTKPTYEEYEEFLESRCFPRTRDKMKLILKDLELPFYEPLMIIQKTEGRMAEDNFWLLIERQ